LLPVQRHRQQKDQENEPRGPATYSDAHSHSFFNDHSHESGGRRLRNIKNEPPNGGHLIWHREIRTILEKH